MPTAVQGRSSLGTLLSYEFELFCSSHKHEAWSDFLFGIFISQLGSGEVDMKSEVYRHWADVNLGEWEAWFWMDNALLLEGRGQIPRRAQAILQALGPSI